MRALFDAVTHGVWVLVDPLCGLLYASVSSRIGRERVQHGNSAFLLKATQPGQRSAIFCEHAFILQKGGKKAVNAQCAIAQARLFKTLANAV